MVSRLALLLLPLASLAVAAPSAENAAPQITTFDVNGSGCPAGSTTTFPASDGSSVDVVFSQFTPQTGSNVPRQNCQATLTVSIPAGQQISLKSVKADGFVQLESRTTANFGAIYYYQGQINQGTASNVIRGPTAKNVDLSSTFGGSPNWSQCGGTVIVNVDLTAYISNGNSTNDGFLSVDEAVFGPFTTRSC